MGTLTEKLDYLKETKSQIKNALVSKGQEVSSSDTFRSYASKISAIDTVNNENLTVDPTISSQTFTPTQGHTGFGEVSVNAVTSAIDSNIQSGNIKKDVTILGVTGTYEGTVISNQDISVTTDGTYTADSGYTGLGTVTVTAGSVSKQKTYNEMAEQLMLINDGEVTFTLTVSPTTAVVMLTSVTNSTDITPTSSSSGVYVYQISADSTKNYNYTVSAKGYTTQTGTVVGGTSDLTITLVEG